MRTLLSFLFIGFGIWAFIDPKGAFSFKANLAKNLGVKMIASPKTYKAVKYMGIVLAIVGLLLFVS